MAQYAGALSVDENFTRSINQASLYPFNLIARLAPPSTLRTLREKLDQEAPRLFFDVSVPSQVHIRDFDPVTKRFKEKKVKTLDGLRQYYGIHRSSTSQGSALQFTKTDPPCRAVFIHGQDSRSMLQVTKEMILEIFSFNQVMPAGVKLLFLFGESAEANDLMFSAFEEQSTLEKRQVDLYCLNRSGLELALCYNLKTANRHDIPASFLKEAHAEWWTEQAGVIHQFDVVTGTTFWTFVRGGFDLEVLFKEVTDHANRSQEDPFRTPSTSFRTSLDVHSKIINRAVESWQRYMDWLAEEVKKTDRLISGSHNTGESGEEDLSIEFNVLYLEGNLKVLKDLYGFYSGLPQHPEVAELLSQESESCKQDCMQTFLKHTQKAIDDMQMELFRARNLRDRVGQRKLLLLYDWDSQLLAEMKNCLVQLGLAGFN